MKDEINYIDLFSGIGGFAKGIKDAGIKIKNHYYSEIDKYCIDVYKKHFPEAKALGDIKMIISEAIRKELKTDKKELKTNNNKNNNNSNNNNINSNDGSNNSEQQIDLITFGFPCQDLSVAGKQGGRDTSLLAITSLSFHRSLPLSRRRRCKERERALTETEADYFLKQLGSLKRSSLHALSLKTRAGCWKSSSLLETLTTHARSLPKENIKGLITNNNGKDFVRCLQEISDIGLYDCEWQSKMLDTAVYCI